MNKLLQSVNGVFEKKLFSIYGPFLLMAIAILGYFIPVVKFNVNVPYSDDFGIALNFLNEFVASSDLSEKIRLLFSQHVDHRLFFPRLVVLIDYLIQGHVNFYTLVIIGNLGLLGIAFVMFKGFSMPVSKTMFFLPVLLLLFQLQHWENSGFPTASIQSFYVLFFSFLALYLISRDSLRDVLLGCLLLFLAIFTSGSGIFVALPGAFVLVTQKRFKVLVIWLVTFGVAAWIYFYHYTSLGPKIIDVVMEKPLQILLTFFAAIGSFANFSKAWEPMGTGYPIAVGIGVFVSLFFIYLLFSKYWVKNSALFSFLFLLMITCAALAVSRSVQYSPNEISTISRYKIVSISMMAICYLIFMDILGAVKKPLLAIAFIGVGIWYNFQGYDKNIDIFKVHTGRLVSSSWAVYTDHDYNQLIDWNPQLAAGILKRSEELKIYQLPDLRDEYVKRIPRSSTFTPLITGTILAPDSTVNYKFQLLSTTEKDIYGVKGGWALVKKKTTRSISFTLKSLSKTYFFSTQQDYRPDVTELMNKVDPEDKTNYNDSGFSFSFDTRKIENGQYTAGLVLQTSDGLNYYIPATERILIEN